MTTPERLREAEAATLDAMRGGADVIFQATFFDGRWRGHADFLYKVDRPSALGPWSYDIADTKLHAAVKASAILQMCVYADLLARLQGGPPEQVYVVTGDGIEHPHRLADFDAYYRFVKARFEVVSWTARGHCRLPRPGRPLSGLCLVPDLHHAPPRRRPSVDRRGIRRVDTERLMADDVLRSAVWRP